MLKVRYDVRDCDKYSYLMKEIDSIILTYQDDTPSEYIKPEYAGPMICEISFLLYSKEFIFSYLTLASLKCDDQELTFTIGRHPDA